MSIKGILSGFLVIAPIAFVVTLLVSYLYGLIVHGTGSLEWESAIRLAIILGITLSLTRLTPSSRASVPLLLPPLQR